MTRRFIIIITSFWKVGNMLVLYNRQLLLSCHEAFYVPQGTSHQTDALLWIIFELPLFTPNEHWFKLFSDRLEEEICEIYWTQIFLGLWCISVVHILYIFNFYSFIAFAFISILCKFLLINSYTTHLHRLRSASTELKKN